MADYTDIIPVQLEAAYNLLQPTSVITAGYKKGAIRADDPGLVGMYKNNGDSWQFGIHPAIADTPLAQDAMRLDMFLAAGAALLKRHASIGLGVTHGQETACHRHFKTGKLSAKDPARLWLLRGLRSRPLAEGRALHGVA
jgi:hypothetical protein